MSSPCSASAPDRASSSCRIDVCAVRLGHVAAGRSTGRSPRREGGAAGSQPPRTWRGAPSRRARRSRRDRATEPRGAGTAVAAPRARDAIAPVCALPGPVASTGIPGGAAEPRSSRTLSRVCMRAARVASSGDSRSALACAGSSATTVKLEIGVGSTCVRRAPTATRRPTLTGNWRCSGSVRETSRTAPSRVVPTRRDRHRPVLRHPHAQPLDRTGEQDLLHLAVADEVGPHVVRVGGRVRLPPGAARPRLRVAASRACRGLRSGCRRTCGNPASGSPHPGTWPRSGWPDACRGRPADRTRAGDPGASRRSGPRARTPPPGRA